MTGSIATPLKLRRQPRAASCIIAARFNAPLVDQLIDGRHAGLGRDTAAMPIAPAGRARARRLRAAAGRQDVRRQWRGATRWSRSAA